VRQFLHCGCKAVAIVACCCCRCCYCCLMVSSVCGYCAALGTSFSSRGRTSQACQWLCMRCDDGCTVLGHCPHPLHPLAPAP
jgi:hypothetical protein